MIPRVNSLLAENKKEEFVALIKKTVDVLFSFSFPIIVVTTIFSPDIVNLLAGKGFEGAFLPTRIIMPLILVIGYEQILVLQILMPMKKDSLIIRNSAIGAIMGVTLNLILVPKYGAVGSSIVWVSCECIILFLSQTAVCRYAKIPIPFRRLLVFIMIYMPAFAVCALFDNFIQQNRLLCLSIACVFVFVYTVFCQLFVLKNPMCFEIIDKMKHHLKREG